MTRGEKIAFDALDSQRRLPYAFSAVYLIMAMSLVCPEKREDMAATIMEGIEREWTWGQIRQSLRVIISEDRSMLA
jgi:hypothetical protein